MKPVIIIDISNTLFNLESKITGLNFIFSEELDIPYKKFCNAFNDAHCIIHKKFKKHNELMLWKETFRLLGENFENHHQIYEFFAIMFTNLPSLFPDTLPFLYILKKEGYRIYATTTKSKTQSPQAAGYNLTLGFGS